MNRSFFRSLGKRNAEVRGQWVQPRIVDTNDLQKHFAKIFTGRDYFQTYEAYLCDSFPHWQSMADSSERLSRQGFGAFGDAEQHKLGF